MSITILHPRQQRPPQISKHGYDDDDEDSDGDIPMEARDPKRRRSQIVTPGETVTSDPQWMRGHGTYLAGDGSGESEEANNIVATVMGTVQTVNKLLSVRPLRARYTPEIGDLVVGRITEVQSKRWKVDINSNQHSALLLSSINLPGGILRKRTHTDELQIRTFFSEGDLLVAEVQSLFQDGSASLHTRSLKYGKLRNGYFIHVDAKGIQRSKTHILTLQTASGGGEVDVVLGVNGYIWIQKKTVLEVAKKDVSITRLEEEASEAIYENKNDYIAPTTRREIARIGNCIRAMVRWNVRVDEAMLNAVYALAIEETETNPDTTDESLEGETGKAIVERVVATRKLAEQQER